MNKITKGNKTLYYQIEERNNKHSYFKPQNGYLLVVKAKRMPEGQIINHINKSFDKYYQLTQKIDSFNLYLWGNLYTLEIKESNDFNYNIMTNKIVVSSNNNDFNWIKINILQTELKQYLLNNLDKYNKTLKKHKIKQVPITIKFLKSKYGSYHYLTNKIVLNAFLATLPKAFTDYVIYHEYAHQLEKNHQKGFYKLLEKLCPNYSYYDNELKKVRVII